MGETMIASLPTVREHTEGDQVELWLNRSGRLVLRAFNECHNNHTDVDLVDLLAWLRTGEAGGVIGDEWGIPPLRIAERDK